MPQTIEARTRRYVNPQSPLGPSDAAKIRDLEVAARLFDHHNRSFNSLLRTDLSVVIGRRGSGKTALVTSYRYRQYLSGDGSVEPDAYDSDFLAYDIVIQIATHKKFEEMQRRIVKDRKAFRFIESVVEDWEKLITDYFLATLLAEAGDGKSKNPLLTDVYKYLRQDQTRLRDAIRKEVWGDSLWSKFKAIVWERKSTSGGRLSQTDAMDKAVEYLESVNQKALILFDSLDEYEIGNHVFDRTVGALIRFISDFNGRQERVKIKLVLPSEIFPEIQKASGNPLKDLVNFDQVQWSPLELMQVAAYRYKLFLSLHDPDYARQLKKLDFKQRNDIHRFWDRFFPKTYINRYSAEEDTLTYILRHTQLLPRQLLRILEKVVTDSRRLTGNYRQFKTEAIRDAIEKMEPVIAGEIFAAFRKLFPYANDLGRAVFGNFPTIFSYDELHTQWRRKAQYQMSKIDVEFEMVHFSDMLIRMGIMGLVIPEEETERYYLGQFGYGSLSGFNVGSGHLLCLHPIFSKCFNASGNPKSKAILPQDVTTLEDYKH